MRVLFITAYYPPCDYGWGYMRICEQVADGLQARGHAVAVLTSHYRHGAEFKPYPVSRTLPVDPDWHKRTPAAWQFFVGRRRREQQAVAALQEMVETFQPDVLFVWHAHGLPRVLLQAAENMSLPTAYYFANYLPEMPDEYVPYWQSLPANPLFRVLKGALARVALWQLAREGKPIRLQYAHTISVSTYVRDRLRRQGLIGADAVVIPNGVDRAVFHSNGRSSHSAPNQTIRAVIAGRVAPEKGIHTVLHALGKLRQQNRLDRLHLTIIGDGPADYRAMLDELLQQYRLGEFVTFAPPVNVTEMPSVYANHDVLLLPSEWDEPLSCTMLEAMACGLLVIGTTTGGSGEALFHERTGLVFPPGDAEALAELLDRIQKEPTLVARLAMAGEQEVITRFDMTHSVARIEAYLAGLLGLPEVEAHVTAES